MPDFFPLEWARCCPAQCVACIPIPCQRIQDCTHFMLLLGIVLGIVLIVFDILVLVGKSGRGTKTFFVSEILGLVFLLPCTYLLVSMMGHYDDRAQSRLKEIAQKKSELTEAYAQMIEDMDGLLGRAAESSAGLAEKNFAAHRRDFIHFLERCLKRYKEAFTGSKVDEVRFVDGFRKLLRHWLKAFEEASVDPQKHPLQLEKFKNEFDLYQNVEQLITVVLDRLRQLELKIVTVRQKEDEAVVENFKHTLEVMDSQRSSVVNATNNQVANQVVRVGPRQDRPPSWGPALLEPMAERAQGLKDLREIAAPPQEEQGCTWCLCCRGNAICGVHRPRLQEGDMYPLIVGLRCCQMTVLCQEHLYIIVGMLFAIGLAVMNGILPFSSKDVDAKEVVVDILPLAIYAVCLATISVRIEAISELLRLEREVQKLKEERKKVEEVSQDMSDFWGDVQKLTDVWLYRTIPRLDLFKECNHYLGDAEVSMVVPMLKEVNDRMDKLEMGIGSLTDWEEHREKEGGDEWQKTFGAGVNRVIRSSQSSTLITLVSALDKEMEDGMVKYDRLNQPAARPGRTPAELIASGMIGTAQPITLGPSMPSATASPPQVGTVELQSVKGA